MNAFENLVAVISKVRGAALTLKLTQARLMDTITVDIMNAQPSLHSPDVVMGAANAVYACLHHEIATYHCDFAYLIRGEVVVCPVGDSAQLLAWAIEYPEHLDPSTPCGFLWKGSHEPYVEMLSSDERAAKHKQDSLTARIGSLSVH